jgi:hypothetical protein
MAKCALPWIAWTSPGPREDRKLTEQKTLFKRVEYDVQGLLEFIEMGDIGLPDIQRPFVWSASKVRDLFDSMFRGFPVGYLLFWENANVAGAKSIGTAMKGHAPGRLIVDGQQRLTSLYAVLRGKAVMDSEYRDVRLEIGFRPRDGKFEVTDAAIRRDPEFIASISEIWAGGTSYGATTKFLTALEAKRELDASEKQRIVGNIDRLFDIRSYPFTALEIAPSVGEEQVADIFVRINSLGAKLNQADFILTLMSVFWDQGRADLERFSRDARKQPTAAGPSAYNRFYHPQPDQLLRTSIALGFKRARLEHVYSILRGKDLDTGLFSESRRDEQFEFLRGAQSRVLDLLSWHEFWKAVASAGYQDRALISSETNLAYTYALFLIGRHDHGADWWTLKKLISRWLYMTALTGRYSGSSETVMDADLAKLRNTKTWDEFSGVLNAEIDGALTDDFWSITLPNNLSTTGTRSPYSLAYRAALNLMDARALLSQEKVSDLIAAGSATKKAGVELHHLFPKAYLRSIGITEQIEYNQIANLAIIGWEVNNYISNDAPSAYWPVWLEKLGTAQNMEQIAYLHALPPGWDTMSYAEFLEARRHQMAAVIRDAYMKLS